MSNAPSKTTASQTLRLANVGPVNNLQDADATPNRVAENAVMGTKVGIVARANDDATDRLTYSLIDSANDRFAINPTTGEVLATGVPIDYESARSYDIVVLVRSTDGSSQTMKFTIEVNDIAENVRLSAQRDSFIENGVTELSVDLGGGDDAYTGDDNANTAFGSDGWDRLDGRGGNDMLNGGAGDDILIGGDGNDILEGGAGNNQIDRGAGVDTAVYAGNWSDYRITRDIQSVVVQNMTARDFVNQNVEQFRFANGTFTADNIIDVAPVIVTRSVAVDENRTGMLADIVATDRNTAVGDKVAFSLKDPNSIFAITADGKLSLKPNATLDAEKQMRHNVVVVATDSKGLQTEATLAVDVRDLSEINVTDLKDVNQAANAVAEGSAAGTRIGVTAQATDDVTARLTYSLDDNAGGRFAINATTGEITTGNTRVDFETAAAHDIVVRVTSSDGSSQTMKLTVGVSDVAENLRLSEGGDVFTERGVSELSVDLAGGNDAYYGDNNANTVLGGAGNDYIDGRGGDDVIDGGAGDDWILGRLGNDRLNGGAGNDLMRGAEGDDTLNGGEGSDTAAFEGAWKDYSIVQTASGVVVTDLVANRSGRDTVTGVERFEFQNDQYDLAEVIDAAPVILTRELAIDENKSGYIGAVLHSDRNATVGDFVTLSLKDPNDSRFQITADGALSLKNGVTLNAEQQASHQIVVVATDTKGMKSEATISVRVRDIAEGAVNNLSDADGATNLVREGAAAGAKVGIVARATDDATDKLTYSLDDNAGGRFAINAATGEVTTTGVATNHESASSHEITVRVTSSDKSFQTMKFKIAVDDIAENIRLSKGVDYYRETGKAELSVDLAGGNDTFWGGEEADIVFGGAGNDYINGAGGNDRINGGAGEDWLLGRTGNDWISGGLGNDFLRGSEGSDTFAFTDINFGNDRIADFQATGVERDAIEFSKSIFSSWASLSANLRQVEDDVVITYGANTVLMESVNMKDLTASHFVFV